MAMEFMVQPPDRESNLEANMLQSGVITQDSTIQAILIGFTIAITAAIGAWIILRKQNEE